MIKLSILIPTTRRRRRFLTHLLKLLYAQIGQTPAISQSGRLQVHNLTDVEIIVDPCENCKIGAKRNVLMDAARGEYLAFFDDDDEPTADYIPVLMAGIATGADCVSLRGIMTTDGQRPEVFEHSLKYRAWATVDGPIKYERNPNHLNAVRTELARQVRFPDTNWGEDRSYSMELQERGLLKSEYYSDKTIYLYKYRTSK